MPRPWNTPSADDVSCNGQTKENSYALDFGAGYLYETLILAFYGAKEMVYAAYKKQKGTKSPTPSLTMMQFLCICYLKKRTSLFVKKISKSLKVLAAN